MVTVIEGGRGAVALERVSGKVRTALHTYLSGGSASPLFLVPPGTDPDAARSEALHLGIPPATGVLMRTSGSTTGTGKIVALSWDALIASAHATHAALRGPGVWACDLPLHHIAGFQTVVRTALVGGSDCVGESGSARAGDVAPLHLDLSSAADIRTKLASASTPVYLSVVPTQLQRILADPAVLEAVRSVVFLVGGAHANPDTLAGARAAGLTVHTSYGMTETCGGCVYDGHPIGDTQILLDEDGRIRLQGSTVALGYLGSDSGFSQTRPRTHHTLDAGRMVDGRLEVLGRIDDAITTGGLTVIPKLIEDSLAKAGWNAVIVGIPHVEWGEAVVAVLDDAGQPAQSCNVTVMRSFVKVDLGSGWAPSYVVGVSDLGGAFPLTDSGKINRRELADMAADYLASSA